MAIESPTYTPAEQGEEGLEGEKLVRQQLENVSQQASTVADIRNGFNNALYKVIEDEDEEAAILIRRHKQEIDDVTNGYDKVRVENFSGGKLGENEVGTHNSAVARDLFSVDADLDTIEETLLHEDGNASGTVGHAGQRPDVEVLAVDKGDGVLAGSELLEGENEAGLSRKLRGSVSKARDGQPDELYGSGQEKVSPHYEAVTNYVRNGADRLDTQTEIFRTAGTTKERVEDLMTLAGYKPEEVEQVEENLNLAA